MSDEPCNTLRNLPPAFRKALCFYFWGRMIRALLMLFCELGLLIVFCYLADDFCADWNEALKKLIVYAALPGILAHVVWFLLSPWFKEKGITDFFGMLSRGSEKAGKIAAPLLTRNMLAKDTGTVIRVLTRGIGHFLPLETLVRAASGGGLRIAVISAAVLLLLLVPLGKDGGFEGKMHTFRSWLMGAKWTNNVPLKILSVFPGGTIIKPDSEWLVKVAFNREPEDARPAVRFETQDGKQEIPLVRISEREYQALMPPFRGECRYAVCAENRHTEYFTIRAEHSKPLIIRNISFRAADKETELLPNLRKWSLPKGAVMTIAVDAPENCIRLLLTGSGGLRRRLTKDPQTGFWQTSFTVWESGAFFFRTLETDGTRGGSDLYTLEIRSDNPPAVKIAEPKNLEPLIHPAAPSVEASDDTALKLVLLHLNTLGGVTETLRQEMPSPDEKEFREQLPLPITKSARLIGSVVALVAEAEENSPTRRNAFSAIQFHPVIVESDSELLNNPRVRQAFQDWFKNKKYEAPNKQIPPPENPAEQEKKEQQKRDQNSGGDSQNRKKDLKDRKGSERGMAGKSNRAQQENSSGGSAEKSDGKKQSGDTASRQKNGSPSQTEQMQSQHSSQQKKQDGQGEKESKCDCPGGNCRNPAHTQGKSSGGQQPGGQGKEDRQQKQQSGSEGKSGAASQPGRKQNAQSPQGQPQSRQQGSQAGNQAGSQSMRQGSQTGQGQDAMPAESSRSGGRNTRLNPGGRKALEQPETQAEVVVGTARRGDEKKRSPQQESPLPENKEKDKPYSMNGDDNRLQSETSGGKRETILLEDPRIKVVPEAKKAPRNRSELENEIRRYDAVRSRLTDEERRTADEYYRRLREILQ